MPDVGQVAHTDRSSLADEAYAEIRARIMDGRIPPGSRVTIRPIAAQLDLSATPVKAALVALEHDGMVVSRLHHGFFVHELSRSDMSEIYEVREALDGVAARRAASEEDRENTAATLRAYCDEQGELLRRNDIDGYREKDLEFHRDLWALCHNARILRIGETLLDQMRLGNALSARLPGRGERSVAEHLAIVDAIADGQGKSASVAACRHIQRTRTAFEKVSPH